MIYQSKCNRTNVNIQPAFRLVDLFEETIAYDRFWCLPFNSLSLCISEDPSNPSWIELTESGKRIPCREGEAYFMTCDTPMRICYTGKNTHLCIHFRYEIFPGVDLFSGIKDRYVLNDPTLIEPIHQVFSEPDPLRRIALAEYAAMGVVLHFWPPALPLDLAEMQQFEILLQYVSKHLDSRLGVPEMASVMGWSEAYFSRKFRSAFGITPKQYLIRELFARAAGLLKDPQKSIKEVAEMLNFSSEFNFSRFIRNCAKCSPSELRRK